VILWDITDPDRPTQQGLPLTGRNDYHSPFVHSVAFSPDGHTLAVSNDKTVILWDITNPTRPIQQGSPLTGHAEDVTSVVFSPAGHILVTTSAGPVLTLPLIILWDLTGLNYLRDHITERACSLTGRGLNPDEWIRYIPGLAYQKTCPD
jgi:WD40 repeat protein